MERYKNNSPSPFMLMGTELHEKFKEVGYAGEYFWVVTGYQGQNLAECVEQLEQKYGLPVRLLVEGETKRFYLSRQKETDLLAQELGGKSYLGKGDIWICELVRDPEKPLLETVHDIEITLL